MIVLSSCQHEPFNPLPNGNGNYPDAVATIIINKCATTGCHNNASYDGAGGLNLTTWDKLFEGGSTGAVVIPYRPDFSTLCFYTNTDSTLGPTLIPVMPVNSNPLSKEEYITLRNWIADGAPSATGNVKFADNPSRSKIYVTNQLCDVVTVFDTETLLQMRYVTVGNKTEEEFPRTVHVAPDKKHWYVSFFTTSGIVQKFSAADDRLTGELNLGAGNWTSFVITTDNRYGFFVDNNNPGKVAYADLENMQLLTTYTFNGKFRYPSGIALNENSHTLCVGNTTGNYIYAIDITERLHPAIKELVIDGTEDLLYHSTLNPADMITDKTSDCIVACSGSNEIRVVDMKTGAIKQAIPLGVSPVHMAYSSARNKLFITCPQDEQSFPGNKGSVVVIDMNTYTIDKKINSGYQPFGIAVDDNRGIVAVVNANLSPNGNKPHHSTNCGGRNGNVSFIDMKTMELIPGMRSEVAVFPYGAATR
ncbi:MAG: hypothetical protein H3C54_04675 [Taibaiella sp.]|nr:hypothetical protein [Taibaiella sp.]